MIQIFFEPSLKTNGVMYVHCTGCLSVIQQTEQVPDAINKIMTFFILFVTRFATDHRTYCTSTDLSKNMQLSYVSCKINKCYTNILLIKISQGLFKYRYVARTAKPLELSAVTRPGRATWHPRFASYRAAVSKMTVS